MKQTNKVVTETKKEKAKDFTPETETMDTIMSDCNKIKDLAGTVYLKARRAFLQHVKETVPSRLHDVLGMLPK
jgi:hypothetical protein